MYRDDAQVIGAVLQGDKDRYGDLVEKYKRMVYGIAWSHLGDSDLSEEVAQETFVKAYCHLDALRDPDRFSGWLARIARNVCNTLGRKANREKAFVERWAQEAAPAQSDDPDRESVEEQMWRSFATLPAVHRETLTIFYLQGKSIREATAILGISETALKTRLHRARVALRQQMEQRLEDSLESLEPREGFTRSVLSVLPLAPNGVLGTGGVAALLGKSAAGLGFAIWMVLAQVSVMSGLMWLFARSEAANIKDTPENQFRKVVLKRVTVLIGTVVIATMVATQLLIVSTDVRTLFKVLAVYELLLLWPALRALRVNTSSTMVATAFMVVVFMLSSAAIGFLGVSMKWLAVSLLAVNVVGFLSGRSRPTRQDYDLFLRAATGGLGDVPADDRRTTPQLTQAQLRAFARLLGNEWLVGDYFPQGDTIRLMLPGLRWRFRSTFGLGSSLIIGPDGSCAAHITPRDLKAVEQSTGVPASAEELETTVCRVVRYALERFVHGDADAARSVLTARSDEAIFRVNTGWTKGFIALMLLAVAACIFMISAAR